MCNILDIASWPTYMCKYVCACLCLSNPEGMMVFSKEIVGLVLLLPVVEWKCVVASVELRKKWAASKKLLAK